MITEFAQYKKYNSNGQNKNCPVCNSVSEKYDSKTIDPDRLDYYKCPLCKFEWYIKYQERHGCGNLTHYYDMYLAAFSVIDDEKIIKGNAINPNLFSEIDIEINKYNL